MNISEIDQVERQYLKITDFENFFKIYQDDSKNYFFNLNSTLYLNAAEDSLLEFICDYDMQWPLISYKLYGTTRLAWLLMKLNNVKAKDAFKIKNVGDKIKYISKDLMINLVTSLNDTNDTNDIKL